LDDLVQSIGLRGVVPGVPCIKEFTNVIVRRRRWLGFVLVRRAGLLKVAHLTTRRATENARAQLIVKHGQVDANRMVQHDHLLKRWV
jgi:hypothetical protein